MASALPTTSATPSATPTIVNDDSSSINEEIEHELYPGPDEKKKDPYLVEFDPDDPMDPKVCLLFSRLVPELTPIARHGLVYTDGI